MIGRITGKVVKLEATARGTFAGIQVPDPRFSSAVDLFWIPLVDLALGDSVDIVLESGGAVELTPTGALTEAK